MRSQQCARCHYRLAVISAFAPVSREFPSYTLAVTGFIRISVSAPAGDCGSSLKGGLEPPWREFGLALPSLSLIFSGYSYSPAKLQISKLRLAGFASAPELTVSVDRIHVAREAAIPCGGTAFRQRHRRRRRSRCRHHRTRLKRPRSSHQ